jgi:hypothetical protein
LLVSIATLFSFLSPFELRRLLLKRIDDSQSPHIGVASFLEFMQSGSDDVSKGESIIKCRLAQKARIVSTKMTTHEVADASTNNILISHNPYRPSIHSVASQSGLDTNSLHTCGDLDADDEVEEGELLDLTAPETTSSNKSIMPIDESEPRTKNQNISPVLATPTSTADDEPKPSPKKKKRKRKSKASLHPTVNRELWYVVYVYSIHFSTLTMAVIHRLFPGRNLHLS